MSPADKVVETLIDSGLDVAFAIADGHELSQHILGPVGNAELMCSYLVIGHGSNI